MRSSKKIQPKTKKLLKIFIAITVSLGLSSLSLTNTPVGDAISNTINQVTNVLLYGTNNDSIVIINDTTANVAAVHNATTIN